MSAPNPELVKALNEAAFHSDMQQLVDNQIESLTTLVRQDSFAYRGPSYSRNTYTVALLLAGDSTIREQARAKGIDVRAFDNIVGQVQQQLLEVVNKPLTGAKVASALCRFVGI